MPTISRLTGRFFSVLILLTLAMLLPPASAFGEAGLQPPPASPPMASNFLTAPPPAARSPHFLAWLAARRFTLPTLARGPELLAQVVTSHLPPSPSPKGAISIAQGPKNQSAPAPTLCQIADTVYRADGTPAQGTALISWPAFTTAAGQAVASGSLTVTLDPSGGFNASLAPNTGASPVGTYYRAIFKLDDDAVQPAWAGEYRVISDFLPVSDVAPADAVQVSAPSRGAAFTAIVRELELQVISLRDDRLEYLLRFSNDAAEPLAFEFESMILPAPLTRIYTTTLPSSSLYLAPLTAAQVTNVIATEITIDAGIAPPPGGGIEVRRSDGGWGTGSNGNLAGRFANQAFNLPRLSRVQGYYLRQYDASSPPKYSRFSALPHVDYPL